MFRIGEFSRVARVSCRLLRYYDEIGLLTPMVVDETTGYRYYGAGQLPRLNRILVLKELGLSLDQIATAMDDDLSAGELRGMLLLRRAEVEQELAAQTERLRMIEGRIAELDRAETDRDDHPPVDDVVFRAEPACTILSVRQHVPSFDVARAHLGELIQVLPRALPRGAMGRLVAILHSPEYEPDALDLELGCVLVGDAATSVPLSGGRTATVRELEGVDRMAVCVRVGPPEVSHATTAAIARHAELAGCRLDGPNREVFLRAPGPGQEPVVEMQFPVIAGRPLTS